MPGWQGTVRIQAMRNIFDVYLGIFIAVTALVTGLAALGDRNAIAGPLLLLSGSAFWTAYKLK
jgi:hypothetical protein